MSDAASRPNRPPAKVTPLRRGPVKQRYRILLALEAAGGGAARHVLDLADGLRLRNHNVALVYSPQRADPGFVAALEQLTDVSVHPLAMRRPVGLHDLHHIRELRELIRSLGPFDLVHGHSSKAGALLRLAASPLRVPCVYTPHAFITLDSEIGMLKRNAYGRVERWLARRASKIICVSEFEYEHARALGIPVERLTVVHNGIHGLPPATRQAVRQEFGIAQDALVVGGVGRLTHQKATERLLSAFAMGTASLPKAELIIVGDGPDRDSLNDLAGRLGLASKIRFLGQADGARVMAAFDIFALPSRYEALPYVLLEAAARGLPIVMTETGGAGAVVRDQQNGFVVPQNDIQSLSARLRELARQPMLRERMGRQSEVIAQSYTADTMVNDTLEVYAACLPEQAGESP